MTVGTVDAIAYGLRECSRLHYVAAGAGLLLLLLLLPDNIDNTDGSSVARTPPQVSPARAHTHTYTLGKTIKYLIIDLLAGYISARETARDRVQA